MDQRLKRPTKVAEGKIPYAGGLFDVLAVIAARNEQEAKTGKLIEEFEEKISNFFALCQNYILKVND